MATVSVINVPVLNQTKVTVTAIVLFMLLLVGGFVHRMLEPVIFSKEKLATYGGTVFDKPRMFRDPALLDQDGKPFTKAFFNGKWTLVFFGFTYCPDVCPTTMSVLASFYNEMQKHGDAKELQVVLVSVDPARDTPEKMRDYVHYFHPAFAGVTGDYMELVRFAGDLNAALTKVPIEGGGYLMEHSGNIAVINPRGDYHGFFRPPFDPLRLRLAFGSVKAKYERDYGK